MGIGCDQSSVRSWLVQPIKELSAAGWCAGRGCALVRQPANRQDSMITSSEDVGGEAGCFSNSRRLIAPSWPLLHYSCISLYHTDTRSFNVCMKIYNNNNKRRRLSAATDNARETAFVFLLISVALQRFNAVLIHGFFTPDVELDL